MVKRWWCVILAMAGVGPVLGLLTATVITHVMPKVYESQAEIELRPGRVDCFTGPMTHGFFPPMYKIKSRNALGKVVEKLDLTRRWGVDREAAVGVLYGMVTTESLREPDVIAIRVRSADGEEARDIAREVALAFKEYFHEIEAREGAMRLEELKKAVAAQEAIVAERRQVLADLVRAKGVAIHDNGATAAQSGEDSKRNLDGEREMAEQMKIKLIGEEISAKMPSESVSLRDEPVIPQSPVSPDLAIYLMAGTALGLLLGLLLAWPVVWALERRRARKVAA